MLPGLHTDERSRSSGIVAHPFPLTNITDLDEAHAYTLQQPLSLFMTLQTTSALVLATRLSLPTLVNISGVCQTAPRLLMRISQLVMPARDRAPFRLIKSVHKAHHCMCRTFSCKLGHCGVERKMTLLLGPQNGATALHGLWQRAAAAPSGIKGGWEGFTTARCLAAT